jgi:hypothetical protein
MPLGTRLQQCSNTASAEHIALGAEDVDQWRMAGYQPSCRYLVQWAERKQREYITSGSVVGALVRYIIHSLWQYLSCIPRWRRCFRSVSLLLLSTVPSCLPFVVILDHSLPRALHHATPQHTHTRHLLQTEMRVGPSAAARLMAVPVGFASTPRDCKAPSSF